MDTDGSGTVSYAELQHMIRAHLGKQCDSECTVCTKNKRDDHPQTSAGAAEAEGVDGRRSSAAQTLQAAARRMPSLLARVAPTTGGAADSPLATSNATILRIPSLPRAKSSDNEQSLEVLRKRSKMVLKMQNLRADINPSSMIKPKP
jgi:hypothetical protein